MFSKLLKLPIAFVLFVAFVVAPVGITISNENETQHDGKLCKKLVKVDYCVTIEEDNCRTSRRKIEVTNADCDTSDSGYTCWLWTEYHLAGDSKCQWLSGKCISEEGELTEQPFKECRDGARVVDSDN